MKSQLHAVDNLLYKKEGKTFTLLGTMEPWEETEELKIHAESMNISVGEFCQLTGTIFAFRTPYELIYFHLLTGQKEVNEMSDEQKELLCSVCNDTRHVRVQRKDGTVIRKNCKNCCPLGSWSEEQWKKLHPPPQS